MLIYIKQPNMFLKKIVTALISCLSMFYLFNHRVKKMAPDFETDFTDWGYQEKLPMHARSTAAKAVKNNLKLTEIIAEPSLIIQAQRVGGP